MTLDEEGTFPFVDHAFADTAKGAQGAQGVLAAGVEPAERKGGVGH